MVDVPAATPVTRPVALTVAMPGDNELHTPPGVPVGSLSAVVAVGHTVKEPEITPATGVRFTVTTAVAATTPQLLVTVYDMVDVPGITPVTKPDAPTVATPGDTELHTPPGSPVASASSVVAVVQTVSVPVIAPALGFGLTVTTTVAASEPQLLVTV